MQFDQRLDDRQAYSQPTMTARSRGIRLPEALEHKRQKLGDDADTRVFYYDLNMRIDSLEDDLDPSAARSEFDRVAQQVPENLLQAVRIAAHQADPGVKKGTDADVLALSGSTHGLDGIVDHLMQTDGLYFEVDLAGDDATHVQQIADDLR